VQKKKHQMLPFFHRRNTDAPFRMKIFKDACDTNTNIYKNNQNFLETLLYFFLFTIHAGARTPGSQNTILLYSWSNLNLQKRGHPLFEDGILPCFFFQTKMHGS
jgi:hypothetical protein